MTASTGWVRTHPAYRAVVRHWPERALLACSGGVDSSALLVLAGLAVQRADIQPFDVVYVDHRTRQASATEGFAVAKLAARFSLSTIQTVVNPADAPGDIASPEERLRMLRYAALARVAEQREIADVVTAHTRDDQVETVLIRLLSGSGGLASSGMSLRTTIATTTGTITVHRPLLQSTRVELVDVLQRVKIDPLIDPSNEDRSYRRNALRHDVVPRVEQAFPGFGSALLRSVDLAARDADYLDRSYLEIAKSISDRSPDAIRVDRSALRDLHPALSTRIVRWAAGSLMPGNQREFGFERVEAVRVAVFGRSGAVVELPYGVVARIERTAIVFERRNLDGDV